MKNTTLARCEFVVAILLTLILVALHFFFLFHIGPLWRDEVSSLNLATKPTFPEFWQSLKFDPFPAAYFLVLRVWDAAGFGHSDLGLRALGFLIGLSLIAALWIACYLIDKSPPLWPLALFAINPLTLEAGDSLRPYGFSLIWIALAFALIWRIASDELGKRVIICSFVVAVLSVQSSFTNALMLLAIGTGGILISVTQKHWRRVGLIISVGLIAGVSLLPYLPIIHATRNWAKIIANKNDVPSVFAVARDAVAVAGTVSYWAWLALGGGLLTAFVIAFWSGLAAIIDLKRDRVMFAGATALIAMLATVAFLCAAQYLVFPRYFLPAMAMVALSIHVFWNALPNRLLIRASSLILALLVSVASLKPSYQSVHMRMTNCDQIAATLEQRAGADDLIIVTSSFYGVSFQRYYRGRAPWLAVPQLSDFSLHRWDLLKEAMTQPDPVPELTSRAETILRAGHKIFLVGKLGPPPPQQPESFPPAPQTEHGWQMEPYLAHWKSELTYWIEHHAVNGNELSIQETQPVNPLETLGLFEVSGWREP